MNEKTIVRHNLMTEKGYAPYCGKNHNGLERTRFDPTKKQFICHRCGWVSKFPKDFIKRYLKKWK